MPSRPILGVKRSRIIQMMLLLGVGLMSTMLAAKSSMVGFIGVSNAEAELAEAVELQETSLYFPIIRNYGQRIVARSYGVNFINSAESPADEQQYANGISTGASFNRFPMYWPQVEKEPGSFDWSAQDRAVISDVAHGLDIDAILLGTPVFYSTGRAIPVDPERPASRGMFTLRAREAAVPKGLYSPVFNDGTDIPGPGKGINSTNKWARFVNLAVNRYKPGGIIAQAQGWPNDVGVLYWEMWNEPDHPWFLISDNVADYARMLKVAYVAAKQADAEAQVIFGGLSNYPYDDAYSYYREVLAIYDEDPLAQDQGYFHDIFATHNYSNSWRSWFYVYRARGTMSEYGMSKPIWLNESGVPVWDDYPGPVWDPNSPYRATKLEQADFVIQSAFYAMYAGAEIIFHFQLYDGCGNQPAGSDFPPHDGSLCEELDVCAGDANGLFTNPRDATCFTQHPSPESPRPNYAAFRVLTNYLVNVEPLWRERPGGDDPYQGPQEWIAFYQPDQKQRIVGMWSRVGEDQIAEIEATSKQAKLLLPDGSIQIIYPDNGSYTVHLPRATNLNTAGAGTPYGIGGEPRILIESMR